MQTWFHRDLRATYHTIRVASPKLMGIAACLHNLGLEVIVIVGHAPHSGHARNERENFFLGVEKLLAQLAALFPSSVPFVCIDANARLGSCSAPGVGGSEPERETDSGELFRGMLCRAALAATNTFWSAGWTWQSTAGSTSRIDYVCCGARWLDNVVDCYAGGEVDLTLDHTSDHRAVVTTFCIEPVAQIVTKDKQARGVNKLNLTNPWLVSKFQDQIWCFQPNASASISEHEELFAAHVRAAAQNVFGSVKGQPTKSWISPITWSFIRIIAPSRRTLHMAFDVAGKRPVCDTYLLRIESIGSTLKRLSAGHPMARCMGPPRVDAEQSL